jgi:cysteine desulfurase/selenocysteine lyase
MMSAQLGDRSLFPSLVAPAYLNHAAISPPSEPVRRAARAVIDDYAERGVGAVMRWVEQREQLRADLADFIGTTPQDIGFVSNTSAGVSALALCMPWQPGDRVLLFEGEFPTNVTPGSRPPAPSA